MMCQNIDNFLVGVDLKYELFYGIVWFMGYQSIDDFGELCELFIVFQKFLEKLVDLQFFFELMQVFCGGLVMVLMVESVLCEYLRMKLLDVQESLMGL